MARTVRRAVRVEGRDRVAIDRATEEFVERNGVTTNVTRRSRTTRRGDRTMTAKKTETKIALTRRTRTEIDELLKPLKRKGYKLEMSQIEITRTRKGKKVTVPRNIYTLVKNGNTIVVGRGSPRRVLEALEAITAGKDPKEVSRVASAKTKGRTPKTNGRGVAKKKAPAPKKDSKLAKVMDDVKKKATKKTAPKKATPKKKVAKKTNGKGGLDVAELTLSGTKLANALLKKFDLRTPDDDKDVRDVFVDDKQVGEISKSGRRWKVDAPFSPNTYDSLTNAKKALAATLVS